MRLIENDPGIYDRVQATARDLVRGLVDAADSAEIPMVAAAIGGLAGFFFSNDEVVDYPGAQGSDGAAYGRFFRGMLAHGIYLPPSRFEALFISAAHTADHIDTAVDAAKRVFATP